MSKLFSLIPPPYGWIIHYGLIALLLVSFAGFFYVKGIDHQQLEDAAADDAARKAAAAFTHEQAQRLAPIAAKAEAQNEQDQAQQPAMQSAISDHLRNERVRQCPAAGGAGVPVLRPSGDAQAAGAGPDAAGSAAAQAADPVDEHIAHDASLYRECYNALNVLEAYASAAGADKP